MGGLLALGFGVDPLFGALTYVAESVSVRLAVDLAIATNARGGPGILIASTTFAAQISGPV